jgi:hypothetical protein
MANELALSTDDFAEVFKHFCHLLLDVFRLILAVHFGTRHVLRVKVAEHFIFLTQFLVLIV